MIDGNRTEWRTIQEINGLVQLHVISNQSVAHLCALLKFLVLAIALNCLVGNPDPNWHW